MVRCRLTVKMPAYSSRTSESTIERAASTAGTRADIGS